MKPLLDKTSTLFKKNELKTLEYIHTRGIFANSYPDLNNAIFASYSNYNGYKKGNKDFDFEFVSDFDIEIEGHLHRIIIHADVKGDYDFMSYSIGIAHKDDNKELVRRFHFDYDHTKIRKNQRAFISHLQYGGKSGNGVTGTIYKTSKIEPGLSVPRLNFPPINLALLLDIVFCEFQNESTKKIIEDAEWRSLIRENEIFTLKNYYNSISNHIDSDKHNKESLVRDICYS